MRSTLSFSLCSALLAASTPLGGAVPTRTPPAASSTSSAVPPALDAADGIKISLHRRGSAELTQEDGSIDFGRSHVRLTFLAQVHLPPHRDRR